MKRFTGSLSLALAVTFAATGCGGSGDPPQTAPTTQAVSPTSATPTPSPTPTPTPTPSPTPTPTPTEWSTQEAGEAYLALADALNAVYSEVFSEAGHEFDGWRAVCTKASGVLAAELPKAEAGLWPAVVESDIAQILAIHRKYQALFDGECQQVTDDASFAVFDSVGSALDPERQITEAGARVREALGLPPPPG